MAPILPPKQYSDPYFVEIEYNKTHVLESSRQDAFTHMIRLTVGETGGGVLHRHMMLGKVHPDHRAATCL